MKCFKPENKHMQNCASGNIFPSDLVIELNRRFGMPFYIPLIALITCFLLSSRKDKKVTFLSKYIFFIIGFVILIGAEISVRYSGISLNHSIFYYLLPLVLLPLIYLFLLRNFKHENLY